jgi:ribosomal protein S18 acetylase RimI-like enzyme
LTLSDKRVVAVSKSISRFTYYYARNGFWLTVARSWLAAKRALFANTMVLLYCDLVGVTCPVTGTRSLEVERKRSLPEVDTGELDQITNFWNPKLGRDRINERFQQGAYLWLIKSAGQLAGYGWTLQGRTIEPHYFPLGPQDVHFFDFHVFSAHRGQGLNPYLVRYILHSLAADGNQRAFIEAAEWNRPQLLSLAKTQFQTFGRAKKWAILRSTVVVWAHNEKMQNEKIQK